jgi:hypothetical protein
MELIVAIESFTIQANGVDGMKLVFFFFVARVKKNKLESVADTDLY